MSSELNTALDQLEAEVFREARQQLEPDQSRIESLWRGVAAATALGAASSGLCASVPPASGTGWATPRPPATPPSAAPAATHPGAVSTHPAPAPTMESGPGLLHRPGLLQRWGQASFGLRALLGAAVGGAILGFAVGRGSTDSGDASGERSARVPPGAAAKSSTARSHDDSVSSAPPGTAADGVDDNTGVALSSLPPNEPEAPTITRGSRAKPEVDRSGATPSSSEQIAEGAKPSFYEELEYLKRAQSALRQGNGALALGLMTSLDSIQPGGALLSERGVAKVLAHCQLGDVESAMLVAQRLAENGMASVYTERLENSCAGAVFSKQ
jgi:hypothetical protein